MTKKNAILVLIAVIFIVFSIIVCFIFFSEHSSREVYKSEVEKKLYYACATYANDFNATLKQMSSVADAVAVQIGGTFSYNEIGECEKNEISRTLKKILGQEPELSAIYVTFDPEKFPGRQEIWYIKRDSKIEKVDSAALAETWLLKSNPNTDYFYDAMENGSFWGGPSWETILQRYNITYTRCITDPDGVKLGIAGTDIVSDDVTDTVSNIKVYGDSRAYLFNDEFEYIAKGEKKELEEGLYDFLKTRMDNFRETPSIYNYDSEENGSSAVSCSRLDNGWYFVIVQPMKTAMQPMTNVVTVTWLLMGLVLALLIILSVLLFKKAFAPAINRLQEQELFIINQSRQAKIGEMVAGITHQLKQPVNNANIVIMNMREDLESGSIDNEQLKEHIDLLAQSVNTMVPIIDDFAGFLKPDREKVSIDVREEIDNCLRLMQMRIQMTDVKAEIRAEDIRIKGYRNEFVQCLLNVLGNAVDALNDHNVEPRLIRVDADSRNGHAEIRVFNNGESIPDALKNSIFEPYTTSKAESGGTGIGLYITRQILREHFAGDIEFRNREDGVEFIIRVPIEGEQQCLNWKC